MNRISSVVSRVVQSWVECNANGEIFETFNCGNRLTEPFSIVYIILSMCMIKPEKKGLSFLVIGRLQNRCGEFVFFLPTSEICDTLCVHNIWYICVHTLLLEPDQLSHTQSMVDTSRGCTNRANVRTPLPRFEKKTQHGRIPIDPAILAAIGHRFIAKEKRKAITKQCQCTGLRQRVRRPETRDFCYA